jgi:hypothetical protein
LHWAVFVVYKMIVINHYICVAAVSVYGGHAMEPEFGDEATSAAEDLAAAVGSNDYQRLTVAIDKAKRVGGVDAGEAQRPLDAITQIRTMRITDPNFVHPEQLLRKTSQIKRMGLVWIL